jgi:hypothetical protein
MSAHYEPVESIDSLTFKYRATDYDKAAAFYGDEGA